ncbi:MAG: hypothetical protein EOP87_16860 [Verrucomicrobiaceae bacterium]|nr:MAG: hypothetical protein EOP87_16860 [Verrucomicrobiaceae bacterium]
MLKKLAMRYLLGLDALVRIFGISIALAVLGHALNFLARWLGQLLLGSPEPGPIHAILFIVFFPFAATAAMAVGEKSLFPLRKKAPDEEVTAQAGQPPSPRSLHGGR